MTNTGLSAGDIMALTKGNDGFLEGNGIIILILFFLIFGFGGNWGNGANSDIATTSQLYASLGQQDLKNDVRSGFTDTALGLSNLNTQILENKFAAQLGFQNLNSNMSSCCCDLKSTIIEQNQATRDLIQANYISGMQNEISDLKNALNNANQTTAITNGILNTVGKWYANPAYYSSCGCNSSII